VLVADPSLGQSPTSEHYALIDSLYVTGDAVSVPIQRREFCSEKLRLGHEYDAYTAQYSRTVKALRQQMGIVSKPKYEELSRSVEAARTISEGYRLKLETHIADHGC
jgi:hypothetical protein